MKIKFAHLLFWSFTLGTLLVGGAIYYEKNQGGVTTYEACAQTDGKPYDPRLGEAPECEEYSTVSLEESKAESIIRGMGKSLMYAVALGVLGLFIGFKIDEHQKNKGKVE